MTQYADLTIHQGNDVIFRLEVLDSDRTPKDLSIFSAKSSFKRTYKSSDTYHFQTATDSAGNLDLILDGTVSDDIKTGRYFYDVFLLKDNTSEKILEGRLEIMPSATSIT